MSLWGQSYLFCLTLWVVLLILSLNPSFSSHTQYNYSLFFIWSAISPTFHALLARFIRCRYQLLYSFLSGRVNRWSISFFFDVCGISERVTEFVCFLVSLRYWRITVITLRYASRKIVYRFCLDYYLPVVCRCCINDFCLASILCR